MGLPHVLNGAVFKNSVEMVRLLIRLGADVNLPDDLWNMLAPVSERRVSAGETPLQQPHSIAEVTRTWFGFYATTVPGNELVAPDARRRTLRCCRDSDTLAKLAPSPR